MKDNKACAEIVKCLEIDRELYVHKGSYIDDPILNIIEKLKNHPSIVSINQRGYMLNNFSFQFVSDDVVSMVINDMDSSKTYQKNNIPPSLLKVNVDVITSILRDDINVNIEKGNFHVNLKNVDITPIFKKFERVLKTNYRAVSILPRLSKIYEKIF